MHYESNLDEIAVGTRPSALRLDAPARAPGPGGGATVGDRIARELAHRIHDRGIRFEGTDGRWPDNAESTARRKGFNAPNYRTGAMLSAEHIAGVVTPTPADVSIQYGTGEADDRGTTDRDRAYYAETGQSAKKIVRSFFGVIDSDADAIADLVGDEWDAAAGGPP